MIIAAGVVVVGIGEPEHENEGVFGFDERSDFAEFHAATFFGKMSFPNPRSQGGT